MIYSEVFFESIFKERCYDVVCDICKEIKWFRNLWYMNLLYFIVNIRIISIIRVSKNFVFKCCYFFFKMNCIV